MNRKMTLFYKLANLELKRVCSGEQTLACIGNLTEEESKLIWGYIIIDYDKYILDHLMDFELIKLEDETINVQMKEESKQNLKKYL